MPHPSHTHCAQKQNMYTPKINEKINAKAAKKQKKHTQNQKKTTNTDTDTGTQKHAINNRNTNTDTDTQKHKIDNRWPCKLPAAPPWAGCRQGRGSRSRTPPRARPPARSTRWPRRGRRAAGVGQGSGPLRASPSGPCGDATGSRPEWHGPAVFNQGPKWGADPCTKKEQFGGLKHTPKSLFSYAFSKT